MRIQGEGPLVPAAGGIEHAASGEEAENLGESTADAFITAGRSDGDPVFITPASFRDTFNMQSLERHFRRLDSISDPRQRQGLWNQLVNFARQCGFPVPEAGTETYEGFLELLRQSGDHLPDRILSFGSALALVDNRSRLLDPERARDIGAERPVLVFLCAEHDHNGWMLSRNGFNALEATVHEDEFDVLYVEVGDDESPQDALADIYGRTGRRIHTLLIAGHGEPQSISLGDPADLEPGVPVESAFLDPTDFHAGDWDGLDAWMAVEGQIVLLSCSTGAQVADVPSQGSDDATPLSMHDHFRNAAPGRRVYAPVRPIYTPRLTFEDDTHEVEVEWSGGQGESA